MPSRIFSDSGMQGQDYSVLNKIAE
jgi:hypothetical protein